MRAMITAKHARRTDNARAVRTARTDCRIMERVRERRDHPLDLGPCEQVTRDVVGRHGLTFAIVRSPLREQTVVRCRDELMHELRVDLNLSLPAIGSFVGGRRRSTVASAVQRHSERLFGMMMVQQSEIGNVQVSA